MANLVNAPNRYKSNILKITAARVAQKPEIASVDAKAETLIIADNK